MKAKLTITVDATLIPEAKLYARARGVSLSHVVETALREKTVATGPSFAERWAGKFQPANRKDERYRLLAKKYL